MPSETNFHLFFYRMHGAKNHSLKIRENRNSLNEIHLLTPDPSSISIPEKLRQYGLFDQSHAQDM
jgi:hypothetical protein